jgi:hypothetical protein
MVVIVPTSLLFRLIVTFNCHLSAFGVGRFLHYYGDFAIMNTVKISYSVPNDDLVISSSRRKTGISKEQSLPPRALHSGIIPTKMRFGRI